MQLLEKVKAHRKDAAAKEDPKAVWNEKADREAGRTAASDGVGFTALEEMEEFADVVRMKDSTGRWIVVVDKVVEDCWWEKQRAHIEERRPDSLGKLWWQVSNKMFERPVVRGGAWISKAAPGLMKWVARARAGALASRVRMVKTNVVKGPDGGPGDPTCECCGAAAEDDVHLLTGCSDSGTDKVIDKVEEVWRAALEKVKQRGRVLGVVDAAAPSRVWFAKFALQWAVGLIPMEAREILGQPMSVAVMVLSEVSLVDGCRSGCGIGSRHSRWRRQGGERTAKKRSRGHTRREE